LTKEPAVEVVKVHIYSHPTWDDKLILEADGKDRDVAVGLVGSGDVSLLEVKEGAASRNVLELLPEFDG
jgi:hypothetical protein